MSSYWVMDRQGLVVGPVGLKVVQDIAAQAKLSLDNKASRDGKTWVPIRDIPELANALFGATTEERRRREIQEAQRIHMLLDRYQEMKTHELFSAKAGASSRDHRPGYLALAKPYHPGRLPRDVDPSLLQACIDMFQFLSSRMSELEKKERGETSPPIPGSTQKTAPAPLATEPKSKTHLPLPTAPQGYELRRQPGKPPDVIIRVSPATVGLFTDHKWMNIAAASLFVPTRDLLPLGTACQLKLHFPGTDRTMSLRGVVALESTSHSQNQTMGYGMRMERATADELAFIRGQIQEIKTAR